jgi:hypothetical protein
VLRGDKQLTEVSRNSLATTLIYNTDPDGRLKTATLPNSLPIT